MLQECMDPDKSRRSRGSGEEGQGSLEGTERVAARESWPVTNETPRYQRPGWQSVCQP